MTRRGAPATQSTSRALSGRALTARSGARGNHAHQMMIEALPDRTIVAPCGGIDQVLAGNRALQLGGTRHAGPQVRREFLFYVGDGARQDEPGEGLGLERDEADLGFFDLFAHLNEFSLAEPHRGKRLSREKEVIREMSLQPRIIV